MWAIIVLTLSLLVLPAEAAQDPTRPPNWLTPQAAEPRATGSLESILIQGSQRLAVIGGQQYREGDRFGDRKIRRIQRDQVILDNGNKLQLYPKLSERSTANRWD